VAGAVGVAAAAAVPAAVAEVAKAAVVEAAAVAEEVAGVAAVALVVVVVPVAEAAAAAATPVGVHHLLPNPRAHTRINKTGHGRSSLAVTPGRFLQILFHGLIISRPSDWF
jgi:hypothetical protein